MSSLSHHLAAVWFADVVGYTALSEEDEAEAWRLVETFQEIVRAMVGRFGGRVVKFLGDGALAEFPSTEDAVRSACALLGAFAAAAAEAGLGEQGLRVGVHVGDVGATPDGDLFGDGVNVASRIQAAAEPGEVWVSEDVRRQLRQRRELQFETRGQRELKGLSRPLAVHAVQVLGEAERSPSGAEAASAAPTVSRTDRLGRLFHRRSAPLVGVGILIALATIGISTWVTTGRDEAAPPAVETTSTTERSVGVLPFVNMSGDPDQEYFSDGLTEEILNELARIPDLKVPARTSSFAFKGTNAPIGDIAEALDVGHVLEGSVRKAGGRVRITAQLIDARSGYHLWSQTYDRDLADVFAVQTEVAEAVAEALRLRLGNGSGSKGRGTTSPAAHELYLRGNYLLMNRYTEPDLRRAQELFEQAVAADSTYAAPWAGIAYTWLVLSDDWVPPREGYPRSKAASTRAVELDPDLDAGHEVFSIVTLFYDWDLEGAERGIRKTLALNPNAVGAHGNLAFLESLRGRDDKAATEIARATELDPLSPFNMEFNARVLLGMREFETAEATARKVLDVDSTNALGHRWLGDVMLATGRVEDALATFRVGLMSNPGLARLLNGEARALAALGRRDEARAIAERMEAEAGERYVRAEEIAGVWAALGDADRAFRWLDRAVEDRSAGIPFLTLYPMYDPLRTDSRFDQLVRKLGLPDPNR